jgi:hypothetical protein
MASSPVMVGDIGCRAGTGVGKNRLLGFNATARRIVKPFR